MCISAALKCTVSHHKPQFIGENAACYQFLYISVHFVFVNLVIKIHTSPTDNFNRSSALAESLFSKMLHLPKSFHREKYSFWSCIRDRKGCNKFHVLKKLEETDVEGSGRLCVLTALSW